MTNKKPYINLTALLTVFMLTSCYSKLIQKAYITNPPNVSLFDSTNVTKMKFVGNFRYFENQMSFKLSDKLGIATDVLCGLHGQYGGDVGLVYFNRLQKNKYFEIASGYGYFNAKSKIKDMFRSDIFILSGGSFYKHDINSIYHKLYFQPSFFFTKVNSDIGLTLRISLPYFTTYNCTYSITSAEMDYTHVPSEYSTMNFKNKMGVIIEPMITYRIKGEKSNQYIQFGMCFSEKVNKVDSLYTSVNYNPPKYYYFRDKKSFPLHANFFINYGIEFKFGNRKKRK